MSNESKPRRRARPSIPDLQVSDAEADNIRRVLRNMRGRSAMEPEQAETLESVVESAISSEPDAKDQALGTPVEATGDVVTADTKIATEALTTVAKSTTVVKSATVAKNEAEPLPLATVVKSATVAKSTTVRAEEKAGFLQIPYTILDNLMRVLEPAEQLVYLRLYRLIHGFDNRTEALISYETLGISCKLAKRTVVRAVDGLVLKGLVERTPVIAGPRGERGNLYRLINAPVVAKPTSAKMATVAKMATMKESERKRHERAAPVAVAPADISLDTELGVDRRIVALTKMVATYKRSHPDAGRAELRTRVQQMVDHERWEDLDVDQIVDAMGDSE